MGTESTPASAEHMEPGSVSSSDQIVRDIVRGLYEGRYVAGQRLVEPDLMHRYNVSRSTVREAIKRLAAEGIAATYAFRGAHIRQLSRIDARNVLLVMELMVGLAARQAAANIAVAGFSERFRESLDTLLAFETEGESYELVRARNRFYRTMTQISGNREVDRLLPSIQVHLVRAQLRLPPQERFADYRAIAKAVLAGDEVAAEDAARSHIRRTAETLDLLPGSAFAPDDQASGSSFKSEDIDIA